VPASYTSDKRVPLLSVMPLPRLMSRLRTYMAGSLVDFVTMHVVAAARQDEAAVDAASRV
jgi:hypothetical protein